MDYRHQGIGLSGCKSARRAVVLSLLSGPRAGIYSDLLGNLGIVHKPEIPAVSKKAYPGIGPWTADQHHTIVSLKIGDTQAPRRSAPHREIRRNQSRYTHRQGSIQGCRVIGVPIILIKLQLPLRQLSLSWNIYMFCIIRNRDVRSGKLLQLLYVRIARDYLHAMARTQYRGPRRQR